MLHILLDKTQLLHTRKYHTIPVITPRLLSYHTTEGTHCPRGKVEGLQVV